MRNHDNIKQNDGNVTIVSNEGNRITAHKPEVRIHDNIKQNDGNVTLVCDEGNQITTHKNEVRNQDNIKLHDDNNDNGEEGKTAHQNQVSKDKFKDKYNPPKR